MVPGWPFVGAATVVIVTPGPDFALVVRQVSRGGRLAGYATVAGVLTGGCAGATASVLGGATLFAARPGLFAVLQWCGAALLGYLGLRSLAAAARALRTRPQPAATRPALTQPAPAQPAAHPTGPPDPARAAVATSRGWRLPYAQGLASNLLNPKVGMFLLAFLPQFVPPGRPVTAAMASLAAAYMVLAAGWLCLVVEVSARLQRRVVPRTGATPSGAARPGLGAGIEAATGTVLIIVAAHLAMG